MGSRPAVRRGWGSLGRRDAPRDSTPAPGVPGTAGPDARHSPRVDIAIASTIAPTDASSEPPPHDLGAEESVLGGLLIDPTELGPLILPRLTSEVLRLRVDETAI